MNSKLEGQISGISLSAFLQMSEMEKTSCTLKISAKDQGYLYVFEGNLVAAETGALKNLEAAYEMLSWENPVITIDHRIIKEENEINQPLMNVLMDGLRLKDERAVIESEGSAEAESTMEDQELELAESDDEELELDLSEEEDAIEYEELGLDKENGDGDETELSLADFDEAAPGQATSSNGEERLSEEIVNKKIKEFQRKVALQCPICRKGKVFTDISATGSEYHFCSNSRCGFIYWQKPYPFKCPLCGSPFLFEFTMGEEMNPGLECPRKTCTFRKMGLEPPSQPPSPSSSDISSPKRRKIVRIRKGK